MGLAGRRESLYDRMCISAPTAVYLSSLSAHLSVCLSANLNAFYQSLGSRLQLLPWDRVLPSVCSGEIPGCSYSHPAKFLDVPRQSSSGLGWPVDRLQTSQAGICLMTGDTGWEQNGFSVLSLLGLIWGPSLSFPFPQAPRLTLLWLLACMLVSLGIGGLWLLLSVQPRSQSNAPSVLYNGFSRGFPGQ